MATILLTEQPDARYVEPHTVRTRDRLRARLWAWRLDRALARGARPDSTAALSLHAHRLIGRNVRQALARDLRKLPGDAAHPRHRLDPVVPICRRGVLHAAGLLEELAARLDGPEPVDACGVAQVRGLLRNSDSPLFNPNGADEFVRALRTTIDALKRFVSV
ncbi:MAG: hypothetical protein ACTHQQ_15830 [Solirubrobacteraceae bacterium]